MIKKDSLSDIANMSVTNNGNIHCINTNGYVYTSVNGGSNFSRTRLNTVGNSFDVFFPDDNNGFTVSGGALFQTTDGGINWSGIFQTTGLSLSPTGFYSLFFLNDTTGWICGEGKIFKSNGNLHSWTQSIFPSSTALASLLNVFATSTATVFASSYYSVFESANEGLNFSILSTLPYIPGPQTSPIPDLHFIDASTGYMCLGTRIFKTINGGISWTPVVSLGGSPIIIEIHFTDANHGWGCTSDGYILRYSM